MATILTNEPRSILSLENKFPNREEEATTKWWRVSHLCCCWSLWSSTTRWSTPTTTTTVSQKIASSVIILNQSSRLVPMWQECSMMWVNLCLAKQGIATMLLLIVHKAMVTVVACHPKTAAALTNVVEITPGLAKKMFQS